MKFYTTRTVRQTIQRTIERQNNLILDEGEIRMEICRALATLVGQSTIDAFSVRVTCGPAAISVAASWVPFGANFWEAYTFVSVGHSITITPGVGRKLNAFARARRYFKDAKRRLGYVLLGDRDAVTE